MTLRRQMMLLIAGPTLVIYGLILGLAAVSQYRQSKLEVERAMTRLASSYAARLDGYLREASRIAVTSARFLESGPTVSDDTVYTMLEDNVRQSPFVYGSCLAFEPSTRRPGDELFAPYVCRDGDGVRRMNIDRSVYNWYSDPKYTWYSEPKRLARNVWSEPYFDDGAGNILMSTYSATFKSGDSFGGVCTVDIDLPRLRETVGRDIDEQLDFVILSKDGRFVFHPDKSRIMSRTVFDYLDDAEERSLSPIFRRVLSGEPGAAWVDGWETSDAVGLFYAPVPSTDWMFVARLPADKVLSDVRRRTLINAAALAATLLLVCGCIYLVARRIAAPITSLERGVESISGGNLDTRIDETAPTVEIRHLAQSFNRMTSDLRSHVDRLAVEKAERQKIEHDLDIARQIQRGLLPTEKPNLAGYDIAGWSRAADKTGGDYYDWQLLPDGRLLVSLADVSGHGVGPALVAAVCRAYTRASLPSAELQLDQVVDRLNDLLVADMPEGRFVTFVGVLLDSQQHQAHMVSAGHGPLFRGVTSGNELIESGADGLPLGLMSDNQYGPANDFPLESGDFIVLVTDGLFEWTNAAGEPYGLERLRTSILALSKSSADDMIRGLYDSATRFVGDVPQPDDVTIVIVRRT